MTCRQLALLLLISAVLVTAMGTAVLAPLRTDPAGP